MILIHPLTASHKNLGLFTQPWLIFIKWCKSSVSRFINSLFLSNDIFNLHHGALARTGLSLKEQSTALWSEYGKRHIHIHITYGFKEEFWHKNTVYSEEAFRMWKIKGELSRGWTHTMPCVIYQFLQSFWDSFLIIVILIKR